MLEQKLFAVAAPELAEAPSSWLPRAAAGQGASTREFAKFLGFSHRGDYDVQFVDMPPRHIAATCGFRAEIFDAVHRMLDVALSLSMTVPVLLAKKNRPRYRYCPECLKTQRTPHFPIHWRIDAYRMCHLHRCLLEEKCPHCAGPVRPQREWMNCGKQKQGMLVPIQN